MGRFRYLRTAIAYFSFELPIIQVLFKESSISNIPIIGNLDGDGGVEVESVTKFSIRAAIDTDYKKLNINREGSTSDQKLDIVSAKRLNILDSTNDQKMDHYCKYENSFYRLTDFANRQFGDYYSYHFHLIRVAPSYLSMT